MSKNGARYIRRNFIALDLVILSLVTGVLLLFFAEVTKVGWTLLVIGTVALLIVLFTSHLEFRWLRHHNAAMVAHQQGDYARAEAHFRKSTEYARQFGPDDNRLAQELNNLATILEFQSRFSEAEQLYKEALAIYERASGPAPSRTLEVQQNLQRLQSQRKKENHSQRLEPQQLPKALRPDTELQLTRIENKRQDSGLFDRIIHAAKDHPALTRKLKEILDVEEGLMLSLLDAQAYHRYGKLALDIASTIHLEIRDQEDLDEFLSWLSGNCEEAIRRIDASGRSLR